MAVLKRRTREKIVIKTNLTVSNRARVTTYDGFSGHIFSYFSNHFVAIFDLMNDLEAIIMLRLH